MRPVLRDRLRGLNTTIDLPESCFYLQCGPGRKEVPMHAENSAGDRIDGSKPNEQPKGRDMNLVFDRGTMQSAARTTSSTVT